MLKEERQSMILEIITLRNKVRSIELSEELEVSEDTIRRDLRELADGGFIKKVHGGALANPKTPEAIHQQGRQPGQEAQRIAEKALGLIQEGQVLILDGGAPGIALAGVLPDTLSLTVFTNSMDIGLLLAQLPFIEAYLLGGQITGRQGLVAGIEATQALQDIHADICFLSADSLHLDFGVTSENRTISMAKQAMAKAAREAVVLCKGDHIGQVKPFRCLPTRDIPTLITEYAADTAALAPFRRAGLTIL
ncbi:DeoR/GlpR family DNA-binding transcription regulator [Phaeodactylibacter luteus]|uniref:DeoR/GlpR transcriptional regulator n=1 Tax=Phaeodactylibacter luteus TaxID=1564516 RepID=A0A5C6RWB3_9BACT|nr:DeoR/GlpR family DNA-binding transcription regulator [Phaeodactylibacter luteus]TXB66513.1 DeoR/GlpR transcriptional regulator [Phaeodactylibacter luteus]